MAEQREQFIAYEEELHGSPELERRVELLNNYGWELSRLEPQRALELSQEAHDLAVQHDLKQAQAYSCRNISHCLRLLSQFANALEYALKGMQIAEELESKELISDLSYVSGGVYSHLADRENSIKYYQRSLDLKEELGDVQGIARALNSLGDYYMTGGEYDKAKEMFLRMLAIDHPLGVLRGIGMYNLGEINYHLGMVEDARTSLENGRELGFDLNFGLMIAYCSGLLGRIASERGEKDRAEEYLYEALKAAEDVNSKEKMFEIQDYLYQHFKRFDEHEKALEHFEQFHNIKEEVFNDTNSQKIQNIQLEHNTQMLQREAELEKEKNRELQKAFDEIETQRQKILKINDQLELLSLVASQTNNGVLILDEKGHTIWVNDGYTAITGYTLDDLANAQPGDLLIGEDTSMAALERMREKSSKQEPFIDQILVYTKEGDQKWIKINNTPIFDDAGNLVQQVEIIDDITKRILAEQELSVRNKLIEEQNRDITASIRYAQHIQEVMLPATDELERVFPEHFVFYKPRDLVSGDFYWYSEIEQYVFLVVADCTGHGVPGALVSMVGQNLLNQVVNDRNVKDPAHALDILDRKMANAFGRGEGKRTNDGMDLVFCVFDMENRMLQCSGAFRPLYIVRNGELEELRSIKSSIGGYNLRKKPFETHSWELQPGDRFYMFSDGVVDQFGGEKGKKLMSKRLKKIIEEVWDLPMSKQRDKITSFWESWKGDIEQIDDVCMIGVQYKG